MGKEDIVHTILGPGNSRRRRSRIHNIDKGVMKKQNRKASINLLCDFAEAFTRQVYPFLVKWASISRTTSENKDCKSF